MPRKSPYNFTLTKDQRHELESRSRKYTLPYRDVMRARIVLMAAEGLENSENSGTARYPAGDSVQMAQAVFRAGSRWPRRSGSEWPTSRLRRLTVLKG